MKKVFFILAMAAFLCSGLPGETVLPEQGMFFGLRTGYAFETKPVNFVVIDRTGSVTRADMKGWTQMVKMDYHVPYYRLSDDNTKADEAVAAMFAKNVKPDREAMAEAAKNAGAGALVVLVVRNMDEYIVNSASPFMFDRDIYVRTVAYADMYAYNSDGNKFIRRFLREADMQPLGREQHPSDTIKWTLGNLLNKMEGKPQI